MTSSRPHSRILMVNTSDSTMRKIHAGSRCSRACENVDDIRGGTERLRDRLQYGTPMIWPSQDAGVFQGNWSTSLPSVPEVVLQPDKAIPARRVSSKPKSLLMVRPHRPTGENHILGIKVNGVEPCGPSLRRASSPWPERCRPKRQSRRTGVRRSQRPCIPPAAWRSHSPDRWRRSAYIQRTLLSSLSGLLTPPRPQRRPQGRQPAGAAAPPAGL